VEAYQGIARAELVPDGPGKETAKGGGAPADRARRRMVADDPGFEIG
jgi:hypothetical protein